MPRYGGIDGYTVFACHYDGSDGATSATDVSDSAHAITFSGDAELDTAIKKFGTAALLFGGTNGYNSVADHADWNFSTGDFTIRMWMYLAGSDASSLLIGSMTASQLGIQPYIAGNRWDVHVGGSIHQFSDNSIPTTQWVHVELTRASGVVRLFRDGTQPDSSWSNSSAVDMNGFYLGRRWDGNYLTGSIDEALIDKGIARHTANFTAPTTANVKGYYGSTDIVKTKIRGVVAGDTDVIKTRVFDLYAGATDIVKSRVLQMYAGATDVVKTRIYELYSGDTDTIKTRLYNLYAGETDTLKTTIEQGTGYHIQLHYPDGDAVNQTTDVASISTPGVTFAMTTLPSAGTTWNLDVSVWEKGDLWTNKDPKYTKRYRVDSDGNFETGIPNAPSNIVGRVRAAGAINITWDYSASNQGVAPAHYELQANTGSGWGALTTVSYNTRVYNATGYADGTSVNTRVRADDGSGNVSAWATATTVTADAEAAGDVRMKQILRDG